MNNDDLVDVLRGDIKFVDIDNTINYYYDKLRELVEPYLDKKKLQYADQFYSDRRDIWALEPDWPKGRIKTNNQKFKRLRERLWHWKRLRNDLTALAFPDHEDTEFDYQIQPIAIKVVKT